MQGYLCMFEEVCQCTRGLICCVPGCVLELWMWYERSARLTRGCSLIRAKLSKEGMKTYQHQRPFVELCIDGTLEREE